MSLGGTFAKNDLIPTAKDVSFQLDGYHTIAANTFRTKLRHPALKSVRNGNVELSKIIKNANSKHSFIIKSPPFNLGKNSSIYSIIVY